MSFIFFFSYARENNSTYLHRFFKDLYEAISTRKGDRQDICFFDQRSIKLGEEWDTKLLGALQESKVLVPLYSPAYFKSDYCGLEWEVFRQREKKLRELRGAGATPSIIKPVIWFPTDPLPRAAAALQYTIGRQNDPHNELGLLEIFKQGFGRYKAAYHEFMRRFADEVMATARALKDDLPRVDAPPSLDGFTNPFREGAGGASHAPRPLGPRFVHFILIANGIEWQPYQPPEPSPIGPLAQRVASDPELNYSSDVIPWGFTQELVDEVRRAEEGRNIVILFVDGLSAESYRELLGRLDEQNFINCSIFVPWNKPHLEAGHNLDELRHRVRGLLSRWATTKHSIYFHDEVYSAAQLSHELRETLVSIEANIVNKAPVSPGRQLPKAVAPRIENTPW